MTVSNERTFGAMSYLLGSPAPRAPVFLGRAFYQVLDGFTTVLFSLPVAMIIFKMRLADMNLLLVLACILLISITTCGLGFLLGSIGLVARDNDSITGNLALAFYVLVGVNFPVDMLPRFMQWVAYGLPMTRGLMAARMALAGAAWADVLPLLVGEVLVGVIYAVLGYSLFLILERRSMVTGMLDNL
jgi:ABC-2 type transport system permease protein